MSEEVLNAIQVLQNAYDNRDVENLPEYGIESQWHRSWPGTIIRVKDLLDEVLYKIGHKDIEYSEGFECEDSSDS